MDKKKEDLLIQSFHALGMRKEAAIVAFSMIKTDEQAEMMFDWIDKHYKENPSEDDIIEIAEKIKKHVTKDLEICKQNEKNSMSKK